MVTIIILLVAGTLLLLSELILPGAVAGLAGLVCLAAGVIMAYTNHGAMMGHIILCLVVVGLLIGMILWFRFFPQSRLGQVFVSKSKVGGPEYEFDQVEGQSGRTMTPLRPSGIAEINGRRWDVVSEGAFIERDVLVKVVQVEGNRIVVRAVEDAA